MAEEEKKIGEEEQRRIDEALKKAREEQERISDEIAKLVASGLRFEDAIREATGQDIKFSEDRLRDAEERFKKEFLSREEELLKKAEETRSQTTKKKVTISTTKKDDVEPSTTISSSVNGGLEAVKELAALSGVAVPENITRDDIKDIIEEIKRKEIVEATKASVFVLNYDIEKIPVPSTGHIYGLTELSRRKQFNKPTVAFEDSTTLEPKILDDVELPDFNVLTKATLKNWTSPSASNIEINVGGDPGTVYRLMFKNITTGEFYNWEQEEFGHGYNMYESKCSPITRDNNITLKIPATNVETEYNLYFIPTDEGTIYDNGPTEEYPWVLNQLVKTKTTIKFLDTGVFSELSGDVVVDHFPGADLSMEKRNGEGLQAGEYKVELNATAVRQGELTLGSSLSSDGDLNIQEHVNSLGEDIYTNTEVLDVNLQASVDGGNGTVSGSITLGKMGLRESTVYIMTGSIFTHKVDGLEYGENI